eukprot:2818063-Pleurochrysis_carterae.AAC.1
MEEEEAASADVESFAVGISHSPHSLPGEDTASICFSTSSKGLSNAEGISNIASYAHDILLSQSLSATS